MKWLLMGELLTNIVRGAFTLALGMILYEVTDSLWGFALVFLSDFVIALLMQSVAGVLIDKHGAGRTLMLICVANTLMFLWFGLSGSTDNDSHKLIILGILFNLSRPFLRAGVFALVHQVAGTTGMEKLNGYLAQAFQTGQMTGMLLTGIVLATFTPQILWLVLGVLYLGAAFAYIMLVSTVGKDADAKGAKRPSGEPIKFITMLKMQPLIGMLTLIGAIDFAFIAIFNLLLAPVVASNYGGSEMWLTYLDLAFAIGALLGGVYVGKSKKEIGTTINYTLMGCATAVGVFICFIYNPPAFFTLLAIFLFGFAITVSTVVWSTALQKASPVEVKGRVGAFKLTVNSIAVALASLLISTASEFSAQMSMTVSIALALIPVVLLPVFFAKIKRHPILAETSA